MNGMNRTLKSVNNISFNKDCSEVNQIRTNTVIVISAFKNQFEHIHTVCIHGHINIQTERQKCKRIDKDHFNTPDMAIRYIKIKSPYAPLE